MVNYGVSPYAISFHPKYERGAERRPINDVDGHGHGALDRLKKALTAIQGDLLYPDDKDVTKFVRVTRYQVFDTFVFAEFGVARAGVEGNLHPSNAARVPIKVDDKSETYVRSVFFAPQNGHEMFWLNERAGQTTAFGIFEKRLRSVLRDAFGDFTYKCAPVADWAAVQSWAESVPVRDMTFVAPREGGSSRSMDVNGVRARVEVSVKPKSRISLRRLLKEEGPDRNLVFGFLADSVFKDSSTTAEGVIASGWSARVTFDTPSGRQRSFGLDTVDQDPTLVYQVGAVSDGRATLQKPTDVEFLSACADFVEDADDLIPSAASIRTDLRVSTPN